ncbi:tRNA glutamyl-Q(34) synthetase GluQRS [Pantoea sp. 18069]|uniref:tRNA glutamyl-Q(34) synthetase GluQRS n=1 Tax=Pantoea sp. 18069 TaxID=2681415 RepID=UPI001359F7F8|nr:tRNA glutamyl-Q(34) synthetase GluQRS [Pantoea sp. 18069]
MTRLQTPTSSYAGRFAPSPTGPLHAGSLVAALASWLDARAHQGRWLVRIEDIDPPRCMAGADDLILQQLAACGLRPDETPVWQSRRCSFYEQALQQLLARRLAYACACTRRDIEMAWERLGMERQRHVERPYPGTCRAGLQGRPARAWRFATEKAARQALPFDGQAAPAWDAADGSLLWQDRRLGAQSQDLVHSVGDFVLRRADGLWAYQLAVVVDDGLQQISHVVRGEDLTDNTPRQMLLQQALGLATPVYLHTPLVRRADGEKLSKQHGARSIDTSTPQACRAALAAAAAALGLPVADCTHKSLADALALWVQAWRANYNHAL